MEFQGNRKPKYPFLAHAQARQDQYYDLNVVTKFCSITCHLGIEHKFTFMNYVIRMAGNHK